MPEPNLASLLDATYRDALAKFRRDVANGDIDLTAELPGFRRLRRDYATSLRLNDPPAAAVALADRLLGTQRLSLSADQRSEFALQTTRLLIRLYDTFIADAETDSGQ